MIIFDYKNKTQLLDADSLQNLFNNPDIVSRPMDYWKEIVQVMFKTDIVHHLQTVLKVKITSYDSSSNVNEFKINGVSGWFDKATRQSLYKLCEVMSDVELVLNGVVITLSSNQLQNLLDLLEIYAHKCYILTALHLQSVAGLNTEEDLFNYDYTSGYPEKISVTL